jgi:sugar lactone lactonase YvrE
MKTFTGFFLLIISCSTVLAVAPQFWEKNTQQQFAEGDPQSVSINSDGELVLAPQLKKLYDGTDPIVWEIATDGKDNLYLATGNEGRVLKYDALGKVTTFLDTPELEVHAIVFSTDGSLYAATSPDGKIYRVTPDGKSSVFFDPPDKYIWSLALDDSGTLYAGTGDEGRIYKIGGDGKGTVLVDTTENNITALLWTEDRKLLAGSDRNGILYSVDLTGKAFVLTDSDLQQITSIYGTPSGEIYFSAITGIVPAPSLRGTPLDVKPQQPTNVQPETPPDTGDEGEVTTSVEISVSPVPVYIPPAAPRTTGASQLYRINPGGFVEVVYTAAEDQMLDIIGYGEDMLLVSTGKKAKLISIDPNKKSSILLKGPEEQMTSLLSAGGKIWVATANPGNLYQLVETHSSQGTYYSEVKDAQTISTWGQISWKAIVPKDTTLTLYTRSGNTKLPDETWSDWSSAGSDPNGAHVQSPRSRFIQWKAEFATTNPASTSVIRSVNLAYLQQNLRPEVLSITLHLPGTVYRKAPIYAQESFAGVSETDGVTQENPESNIQVQPGFDFGGGLGKREIRRGFQTITWNAVDQNQDELRYDLSYRSETDRTWKELVTNLKERVFAWDTQTLPDGTYTIRVTANDSGSNPKEYVLNNSKESTPFDVDNSAPTINVKEAIHQEDKYVLTVQVNDQFSAVRDLQYSVTPGEWVVVFPIDSINDSLTEDYRIEVTNLPAGVDTVILRCSDRVRNSTTTKFKLPK